MGGVGRRRGRRHADELGQGEALDFWRVARIIEGRLLLLRAGMYLPGRAWLQFECTPKGAANSILRLNAYCEPKGFWGRA
jgi:hypothetical protein